MKRAWAAIVVLSLLSGCGGESARTPAESGDKTARPAAPAPEDDDQQVSMTGSMTLKLFEPDIGGDQPRGATFEVSSPKCSLLEEGVWALTPATAVVYGKNGEQTRFEAGSAQFDDNKKAATLKDGVKVDIGTQHVTLEDMTWSNDEGVARSDHIVTVIDGDTKLTAGGMEFRPSTKTLTLRQVTGTVSLKERSGTP